MELNFNSVETIPMLNASAAFKTDSGKVFKEDVDIVPTIIDKSLSYSDETLAGAIGVSKRVPKRKNK